MEVVPGIAHLGYVAVLIDGIITGPPVDAATMLPERFVFRLRFSYSVIAFDVMVAANEELIGPITTFRNGGLDVVSSGNGAAGEYSEILRVGAPLSQRAAWILIVEIHNLQGMPGLELRVGVRGGQTSAEAEEDHLVLRYWEGADLAKPAENFIRHKQPRFFRGMTHFSWRLA